MKNKRLFFLSCFLLLFSIMIQANEKQVEPSQKFKFLSYSDSADLVGFNTNSAGIVKFAASADDGVSNDSGKLILAGVICVLFGVVGLVGGVAMIYINEVGLGFAKDPLISVAYWNDNKNFGWAGLCMGITFTTLGGLLLIAGIACIIAGALMGTSKSTRIFMERESDFSKTAMGLAIKL